MLTLSALAALADAYRDDLNTPVAPLLVGDRSWDVDVRPAIMGCVNLSRDSTYRESVAVSTESAIRKARIMAAQGADFVDIGAESSTAKAPFRLEHVRFQSGCANAPRCVTFLRGSEYVHEQQAHV